MVDSLDSLRTRVKKLNDATAVTDPKSVLYVMSRDCRVHTNHALLAAQQQALLLKLPLVVAFVAYDRQLGNRAKEHMAFLLEGLIDVQAGLSALGISFVLRSGEAHEECATLVKELTPAAVYFDFSPLRHATDFKSEFASRLKVPVFVVDTHNVVPLWVASEKQEVGARTLRPKIHKLLAAYMHDTVRLQNHPYEWKAELYSEQIPELSKQILALYPSNGTDISRFKPGENSAHAALADFLLHRLPGYSENRNDPSKDTLSELSPYLHFGQLSSLSVAIAVYDELNRAAVKQADVDTLIEEMIVRKELADNYCFYNPHYDRLQGAPEWAQKTLAKHANDTREFLYTLEQFEKAETHDAAWNAAQLQLIRTGKMHGYMRMYWAKKILEWSESPERAIEILLYLNDFYHLDGGDPNGYVGIMWSVAGVHDRPWGERAVYGVIRSMVYNGLKRKFDIQAYIDQYS